MNNSERYISLTESEYDKLTNKTGFFKSVKEALFGKELELRKVTEKTIKTKFTQIEKWQSDYELIASNLKSNIRDVALETAGLLKQLNNNFIEYQIESKEIFNSLKKETGEILEKQANYILDLINNEKEQLNKELSYLKKNIDYLFFDREQKKDLIKLLFKDLEKLFFEIKKLPQDKKELNIIKRNLNDLIDSIERDFLDSAYVISKKTFWQMVDYQTNVLENQKKYIVQYSKSLAKINLFIEELEINRERDIFLEICSEKISYLIDIDYWSNGYINDLKDKHLVLLKTVKNGFEKLSFENLLYVDKKVEKDQFLLKSILYTAKLNLIDSQIRYNLAEKMVNLLIKEYFIMNNSYYEENDFKNDYNIELSNNSGNKILIKISSNYSNNKVIISQKNKYTFPIVSFKLVNDDFDSISSDRYQELVSLIENNGIRLAKLN